jgi:hypothetical protein
LGASSEMTKIYIKENSWLARLAAKKLGSERMAIVWRRTVHLHNTTRQEFLSDRHWLNHELKHVAQFRQYGWLWFAILYVWESMRNGYFNNRFEQEARMSEDRPCIPFTVAD